MNGFHVFKKLASCQILRHRALFAWSQCTKFNEEKVYDLGKYYDDGQGRKAGAKRISPTNFQNPSIIIWLE